MSQFSCCSSETFAPSASPPLIFVAPLAIHFFSFLLGVLIILGPGHSLDFFLISFSFILSTFDVYFNPSFGACLESPLIPFCCVRFCPPPFSPSFFPLMWNPGLMSRLLLASFLPFTGSSTAQSHTLPFSEILIRYSLAEVLPLFRLIVPQQCGVHFLVIDTKVASPFSQIFFVVDDAIVFFSFFPLVCQVVFA